MKIKLIILFLLSSVIIYITYNHTYKKTINIVSINSLYHKDNYNSYLSDLLSKSNLNCKFNIDYTNENLEIENILTKIENNYSDIQVLLHKADVIILSIGNIDYKQEELKTIIQELESLFKKLRKINTKQIYYISPSIIKNTSHIKELCHRYNIIFLNGSSFKNKNNLLTQIIYNKIANIYK